MIRSVVNRALKVVLSELFLDVSDDAVHVSMGADLFAESRLSFKNLTWRPDIFDAYLQPLRLVSGHLEKLTIEGFAELALGGSAKCQLDNIFFLFEVDTEADAQRVQFLKKLLVEIASNNIQHLILRELVKQIQGFSNGKDPDIRKKRSLMIRSLNYFFNSVHILVNTVHIRIEYKTKNNSIGALGITIPSIRLNPSTRRPEGIGKSDPAVAFSANSIQFYADYDCESYRANGDSPSAIFKQFQEKWKSESHIAIFFPFDVEVLFGVEIQKKSGLFLPKFAVTIPTIRFVCDPRQLELIGDIFELIVLANIRYRQLARVRVAFTKDELPRLYSTGGSHILPQLSSGQNVYPSNMMIPRNAAGTGLVALMKAKMGHRWKKALWKHLIRLVMEDVRSTLPLGNWIRVAQMAHARKDYATTYCKLLKKSKDTGNYFYDVNGNIDPEILRKLFEYEMKLPVSAISRYRALGHMIALVETINSRRLQLKTSRANNPAVQPAPYENINITWTDLILIQSELYEAQQESAFKSFSKRSGSAGVARDSGNTEDDADDNASVISGTSWTSNMNASAGASVGSKPISSMQAAHHTPQSSATPSGSIFSLFSKATTPAASVSASSSSTTGTPAAAGMLQQTMKIINAVKQATALPSADELDFKLFGRSEIVAFGDFLGKAEPEVKASVLMSKFDKVAAQQTAAKAENVSFDRLDQRLLDPSPSTVTITSCVHWVMMRHQPAFTIVPPDIHFKLDSTNIMFRFPVINGIREDIGHVKLGTISFDLVISSLAFQQQGPGYNLAASTAAPNPIKALQPSSVSSPGPAFGPGRVLGGINSLLNNVNLPVGMSTPAKASLPAMVSPASPGSTAGLGAVKSLQGFASLVGSLIQIKAAVGSINIEVSVKDKDLMAAMNGAHNDDETPLADDEVNMNGERVLSFIRENEGKYKDLGVGNEGHVTVLQAMEVAEREEHLRLQKLSQPSQLSIFKSVDSFFSLCIMLDFDESSEGAADVQLLFGKCVATINGILLSRVMDEGTIRQSNHALRGLNTIYNLLSLAEEQAYIIDHDMRISSAVMSYFGVKSVKTPKVASPNDTGLNGPVSSNPSGAIDHENESNHSGRNSDNDDADNIAAQLLKYYSSEAGNEEAAVNPLPPAQSSTTIRNKASGRRQAVIDNLNFTKWHIIARHYVPTALTICLRTDQVILSSLASCTLRNIMVSVVRRFADRASKRAPKSNGKQSVEQETSMFRMMIDILFAARALNLRDKEYNFDDEEISSVQLSPYEVLLHKTQIPAPRIVAKLFGIELKLPVTDETLCQGVAMVLAKYAPFYK